MKPRGAAAGMAAALILILAGPVRAAELLVLDWDPKIVTKDDHGFPKYYSLTGAANGNWVSPVNYAAGTLYHRLELRSMPTSQPITWQCCFTQNGNDRENCGSMTPVTNGPAPGAAPVVYTWTSSISGMWKLNGIAIDWTQARSSLFLPVRQSGSQYISDYAQLNDGNLWAGEDPDDWYPMEMRFTCVVVSPGGSFSGWGNYINPNQVRTPYFPTNSGSFLNSVDITIACSTPGAEIRYTLDGTDPATGSTLYGGAVRLTATTVVKARAYKSGMTASNVQTIQYWVTTDTQAPIMGIITVLDANHITVRFSEKVDPATAGTASNYSISGGVAVTSASLGTDGQTVTLTTSTVAGSTTYTITCSNVKDLAGNEITPNSQRNFTTGTVGVHWLTEEARVGDMGFTLTFPCRDRAAAVICVPAARMVKAGVTDMEGRDVIPAQEYALIPGSNRISFATGNLPAGMYLCRVAAGGMVLVRRMVIMK